MSTRTLAAVTGVSDTTIQRIWAARGLNRTGQGLQGIARSQVRREARRHRRSVPVPARARAGAVLRREEPGAGARSHPAGPAAEAGPGRHHDPRLQAPRHHHAVRGDEHLRRHRHLPLRAAPSSSRVARFPAPDQPRNAGGQVPASDLRQLRDAQASKVKECWPSTHASTFTSPQPRRPGSTWSSASSATSRPAFAPRCVSQRPELTAAIKEYIALHNQNPKPFVWTAKANDILAKVIRANRNLSSKQTNTTSGCRPVEHPGVQPDPRRRRCAPSPRLPIGSKIGGERAPRNARFATRSRPAYACQSLATCGEAFSSSGCN